MSRLRHWFSSTAWAIADQVFVSSSGFVLNVLGGRWLAPAEYGAYSFVLSVYLIVYVTHYAVLVEPMLLLAGTEFEQRQLVYFRNLIRLHVLLTMSCGGLFALFGLLELSLGRRDLGWAFVSVGASIPFTTLLQLLRRVWYVRQLPRRAALGTLLNVVMTGLGLGLLRALDLVNEVSLLILFGVGALPCCLWWFVSLRVYRESNATLTLREVWQPHLHQARFGVATVLLQWVPMNVYYVLFPMLVGGPAGLAGAGTLKALSNLIQPAVLTNASLLGMLIPALRARATGKELSGYEHAAAMVASSLFWTGVLATIPERLGRLFYGASFDFPAGARWPLALLPALLGVVAITRAFCLARMRLVTPLLASASAALVALTLGVWAMRRDEVSGALWGMVIAALAQALVLVNGLRPSTGRYATPR